MMLVTADKSIVILALSRPRSKTYSLVCFGRKRHYRKDGSCKHTDAAMERIKPDARRRVKIEPFGGKTPEPNQ